MPNHVTFCPYTIGEDAYDAIPDVCAKLGSRLLLDMKPYLDKTRFCALSDPQVWGSAVTNGIFVRFGDVELSHDEILSMAEQEH